MNDEIKEEKSEEKNEQKKGKFDPAKFSLVVPKLKQKLKLSTQKDSGDREQEKKIKKVPKRSGISVLSGKVTKKRVSRPEKKEEAAGEQQKRKLFPKLGKKNRDSRPERDLTTSSHTAQRIDRERQKIRMERLEARKAQLLKTRLILGGAAAALVLLVALIAAWPGKKQKAEAEAAAKAAAEAAAGAVSSEEVRHFSFRVLLSDDMAGDNSILTVGQFREILQRLYDSNYILVDFYSIAGVQEQEDGSKTFSTASLDIPEGKIPFVLSQRDVSYSLDRIGKGYASRMIVTEDGQLTNQYQAADGTLVQGAYDVAPILEEFIAEHPDFAYENARGILALTGYNGILGYRTSELLGKTAEEGNQYAVYGTFDVNAEREACRPVVEALKQRGWHFASYGNNYCSYGAEYDMMVSDMETWKNNVSDLIGGTDLLVFPCETDIGTWSEYKEDNQKYSYLKGLGFNYFCIEEKVNPSWLQIRSGYVRQGIKEIDSYDDFTQIMGE